MAIEWEARVNRPVTVGTAARLTAVRLATLLGVPVDAIEVDVCGYPGTAEQLEVPRDPFGSPEARAFDCDFMVTSLNATAVISLAEHLPRTEDPETGLFVTVSPHRTNESQVLAIAAACAFAECADSPVIDESGYVSDTRYTAPQEVIERLRVPVAAEADMTAAVQAVLARTKLRRDY
jgi:hypothetical protein